MKRVVWLFAFGYFAAYVVYAALAKLVTTGLSGFEVLPATIAATIVALLAIVTSLGWWKYATRGLPERTVIVSGIGTAVIIATTTLAYSFQGMSIVFTLLLLRGGVLILAPIVDKLLGRTVRWFCWGALTVSFAALAVALVAVGEYRITLIAAVDVALYLAGYTLRLPSMTALAKVNDRAITRGYMIDEMRVALAVLALIPLLLAFAGGEIGAAARRGLTSFWTADALTGAVALGATYAVLYIFGTLIYLDWRENTFCVPLNRGSSLLAGVVASWLLSSAFGAPPVPPSQLIAAALMLVALLFLSPAHHIFEWMRDAAATRMQSKV